jgi:hypothetical protein
VNINPSRVLMRPIRVKSMILFGSVIAYIAMSIAVFFLWVAPTLDGRSDLRIAADSSSYLDLADALREGRLDPVMAAALLSFPNTLLFPVLLALMLKSTFAMVLANYAMFFMAIFLFKKSFSFSTGVFLGLLLLNATTTVSLLSVNKEIVDLLAISIFFFARRTHRHGLLFLTLLLALLNRYEVCLVMVIFLVAKSRLNPLRQRRIATMVTVVIALSVLLPLSAARVMATRFEEASGGGLIAWLDSLEMHYLYALVVIPKIAQSFFGALFTFSQVQASYEQSDFANSYILVSNNLASAIVLCILMLRRKITVHSDILYFALLGCIVMAIALVIQPRYFYFAYVLFCLQAAHGEDIVRMVSLQPNPHRELENA